MNIILFFLVWGEQASPKFNYRSNSRREPTKLYNNKHTRNQKNPNCYTKLESFLLKLFLLLTTYYHIIIMATKILFTVDRFE